MLNLFKSKGMPTTKTVLFAAECRDGMNGNVMVSGTSNINGRVYRNEKVPFSIVGQLGKPMLTPALLTTIWEAANEIGLTVHECVDLFENPAHAPKEETMSGVHSVNDLTPGVTSGA